MKIVEKGKIVTYNFKLLPEFTMLSELRKNLEDIFNKENLFDDLTRKNILLAVTELFINIVEHGQVSQNKFVKFHIKRKSSSFELTLLDEGNSYDPLNIKLPDISELPEHGFGLFLIDSLMDSFEYFPKDRNYTYNTNKITKKIEM